LNKSERSSDLRPPQTDIRGKRHEEHAAEHSWSILIVVQPFCLSLSEFIRAIYEDACRIGNGHESSKCKHRCANQSPGVRGWDKVEKRRRNSANEDGVVEPFLLENNDSANGEQTIPAQEKR